MASPNKKNASVIVQRRRDSIALTPCILGFASLVEPDAYDPDKPLFKLDACYSPAGIIALAEMVQRECIGDGADPKSNLFKLREEMSAIPGLKDLVKKPAQSASEWLEGKLKAPKETARVPLPKMVVACKSSYKNRSGETITREIGCWDAHNNPLDLKKLRLGMGSTVQPIVNANLFISKLIGFPQPKLDLVGVRVLKLVQFGGQRPPQETDEEAIREVLGEEFQMDEDLSAYAAGGLPGVAPSPPSADETVAGAF